MATLRSSVTSQELGVIVVAPWFTDFKWRASNFIFLNFRRPSRVVSAHRWWKSYISVYIFCRVLWKSRWRETLSIFTISLFVAFLNVPLKRGAQVAVSRGLHLKSKLVDARSRVHVSFQENRDVFDL